VKHNWSITLLLVGMFLLAQVVGLGILNAYVDVQKTAATGEVAWKNLPAVAGYSMERPDVEPGVSVAYILIALLIGTILILLIVRWQKVMLWKVWFWLAVALCLHIAFSAFVSSGVAFTLALVLATLKIFKPNVLVHNATELFIYGGLAVIFVPLLTPITAIVLLLLISVYDMYAVWRSQHMATMAKFQAQSGIFAGLLLPYAPQKLVFTRKEARGEKVRTAILGGGDIGFPLIFAGVIMKTFGLQLSVLIPLGATLALFGLLLYGQKKKFYPAMPFLTAGCLLGYGLLLLLA
jgi:presenilin-like A22 family membrane protease